MSKWIKVSSIILQFLDRQDSDANTKSNNFPIKSSCTSLNIFIETSMEDIKPVATEKNEFE